MAVQEDAEDIVGGESDERTGVAASGSGKRNDEKYKAEANEMKERNKFIEHTIFTSIHKFIQAIIKPKLFWQHHYTISSSHYLKTSLNAINCFYQSY